MTPIDVDLRPATDQVEDQGRVGNCMAMGSHKFIEVCYERIGAKLNLSAAWLYFYARQKENLLGTREDGIRFLGTMASILINKGCALESSWPTTQYNKEVAPPKELDEEAAQYRALSWVDGDPKLSWMKEQLAKGIPVVMTMIVTEDLVGKGYACADWKQFDWNVEVDSAKNPMIGQHCVLCIGYDDVSQRILLQNSWGPKWADGGFFGVPYSKMNRVFLGAMIFDKLQIPFVNAGWAPEPKERFDRLMDWAEAKFSLGHEATAEFGPYLYRKYGEVYIGMDTTRNMIVRYVTAFEDLGTEAFWTEQMGADHA